MCVWAAKNSPMVINSGPAVLYSLLYMSTAQILFTPARIEELLSQSRTNNARLSITGLLIFRDGAFMQLLEGPQAAVEGLFRKIKADERHYAIVTLAEGPIPQRRFPRWSMDFRNLRDPAVRKLPGLHEFDDSVFNASELSTEPALAIQLLKVFQDAK